MPHTHHDGGRVCDLPTKKACDDRYAQRQAEEQVKLAQRIVSQGRAKSFKGSTMFDQLVQIVNGTKDIITNDEGNPSQSSWARRLTTALKQLGVN